MRPLFHPLQSLSRLLRLVLVPILASMLVAMSAADMRATVINLQMQAGSTRIYEMHDEPLVRPGFIRLAQQHRLGRRPVEVPMDRALLVWPAAPAAIASDALPPAGPRAPPIHKRGPPVES